MSPGSAWNSAVTERDIVLLHGVAHPLVEGVPEKTGLLNATAFGLPYKFDQVMRLPGLRAIVACP